MTKQTGMQTRGARQTSPLRQFQREGITARLTGDEPGSHSGWWECTGPFAATTTVSADSRSIREVVREARHNIETNVWLLQALQRYGVTAPIGTVEDDNKWRHLAPSARATLLANHVLTGYLVELFDFEREWVPKRAAASSPQEIAKKRDVALSLAEGMSHEVWKQLTQSHTLRTWVSCTLRVGLFASIGTALKSALTGEPTDFSEFTHNGITYTTIGPKVPLPQRAGEGQENLTWLLARNQAGTLYWVSYAESGGAKGTVLSEFNLYPVKRYDSMSQLSAASSTS